MAELRDGVRLQKLRPVKGQLQEERKHALLIELVQCEAGKNMKFVSSRLLPYAFSFFVVLFSFGINLDIRIFPYYFLLCTCLEKASRLKGRISILLASCRRNVHKKLHLRGNISRPRQLPFSVLTEIKDTTSFMLYLK